jgi:predicted RNA-binding protein Jag
MENWNDLLKNILSGAGLTDYSIDVDSEHHHATVFIHDSPAFIKENLPALVECLNHIVQLIARKHDTQPIFVDINNYRKERERLIVELARATARKAVATKAEVPLPVMNSYERRLAHMELAAHPDVRTESFGKGHGRYVVVKPIDGTAPTPSSAAPTKYNSSASAPTD